MFDPDELIEITTLEDAMRGETRFYDPKTGRESVKPILNRYSCPIWRQHEVWIGASRPDYRRPPQTNTETQV